MSDDHDIGPTVEAAIAADAAERAVSAAREAERLAAESAAAAIAEAQIDAAETVADVQEAQAETEDTLAWMRQAMENQDARLGVLGDGLADVLTLLRSSTPPQPDPDPVVIMAPETAPPKEPQTVPDDAAPTDSSAPEAPRKRHRPRL